ncbi:MAG: pilus assembly protein TadG, partial [Proteobacteria bacterium]|nr:pilus assembly protein TadG [Pseudomonadota bacterium]
MTFIKRFLKDRRGAVSVTVALFLVATIGFGAMAVDLGHFYVTRAELQNAAD